MSELQTQPTSPPPSPPFQFSLRTLLLLFVVLGSSLGVFGAWGIVVFALSIGLTIYVHPVESLRPLGCLPSFGLCLICLFGLLSDVESRDEAPRPRCGTNLKQIAQALRDYHAANGCFPPAYIADKNGKPMHSWRVLILPYLDSDPRYEAYDFSEPWDGPKNKSLLAARPAVYACPSDNSARAAGAIQTSYVAVVGPQAAWAGEKSRKLTDFRGGSVMVVEVADSGIPWSEPRDLSLDTLGAGEDKSPALALSSKHGRRAEFFFTYDYGSGVNVAMAGGSVHFLRTGNRSPDDLRKLLQIGGFKDEETGDPAWHPNWPNIAALAVWLLSVGTLLTCAVRSRKPRAAVRSETA